MFDEFDSHVLDWIAQLPNHHERERDVRDMGQWFEALCERDDDKAEIERLNSAMKKQVAVQAPVILPIVEVLQTHAAPLRTENALNVNQLKMPSKSAAQGPEFSMTRAAMVDQHKHQWPSIENDISNASQNGLVNAKSGAKGWHESAALAWARANNKLKSAKPASSELTHAIHNMSSLPTTRHRLKD